MVPGQVLSHYRVEEKIGEGGMGIVYRALDIRLERDVALKVLPAGMLSNADSRKAFRNEALVLAKLNHPNICSIFDFDSENDIDFLVMEYVPGVSLEERLLSGSLPLDEVTRFGVQLAAGLSAAHEHGVLHRDLKPGNLRLTSDGRLKILDFGLARLFHPKTSPEATVTLDKATSFSGTVPYMAPEQLRDETTDVRTDIYSTGAVLFEMATGRRLFPEPQMAKLIDAILNQPPPQASSVSRSIPPGLDSVVRKAVERRPERRYQSARELQTDLERVAASQPPVVAHPSRSLFQRPVLALLAVLLAVGVALGWYFSGGRGRFAGSSREAKKATGPGARKATRRSIAVLGFKNLSGRPDDSWLSTALSEMLTTELAGGERLRTVAGETVARMKTNLALADADSYAGDTLRQIRGQLDSDVVVTGSYVVLPDGAQIRLDLRLQDTSSGEILAAVKETGRESELFDLVARAGKKLRTSLGVPDLSGDDSVRIRAAASSTPEGARLYAEGLEELRVFDSVAARDLLEKAVAADPTNALAHSALSSAWKQLGYDSRASQIAKQAFDLSAGLPREDRLLIEARYRESVNDWKRAVETYQSLIQAFPDVLDYRERLAMAQGSAGKAQDASATLDRARAAFALSDDDPRFDSVEASIADHLGDFKRERAAAASAAAKARKRGERLTLARALLLEGWALGNMGSAADAAAASREAKAIYESVGDRVGIARSIHNLGIIALDAGRLDEAQQQFEAAVTIRRAIQDNSGLGRALNNLALIREHRGDTEGAFQLYQESLAIARRIDDKEAVGNALANIGNIYSEQGRPGDAKKSFDQALALYRTIGLKSGVAAALTNLGVLESEAGNYDAARDFLIEAAGSFQEIGNQSGIAQVRISLGDIFLNQGDFANARKSYQQSFDLAKPAGDLSSAVISKIAIGDLDRMEGDFASARAAFDQALAFGKDSGDAQLAAGASRGLAVLLFDQGDLAGSDKMLDGILASALKAGDTETLAAGLDLRGAVRIAQDDLADAGRSYQKALDLHRKRKDARSAVISSLGLARVQVWQNRPGNGRSDARKVAEYAHRRNNPLIETEATVLLARIAREEHKIGDAQKLIEQAARVLPSNVSVSLELDQAVEAARIQSAAESGKEGLEKLNTALSGLGPRAGTLSQFEARLAQAEIEFKVGDRAAAQANLASLQKDATAKGFRLISRKATLLRTAGVGR